MDKEMKIVAYCIVIFNTIMIGYSVNNQQLFTATFITIITLILLLYMKGNKLARYLINKYI